MGNSMCKQQNPGGVKGGFQNFMSGCSNLCTCPTGLTQKNYHWKKQVQTTRPPYLSGHTASTKWHNATTLTSEQPLKQKSPLLDEPPVPPPRKKRLRRSRSYEDVTDVKKAGFKEVFGENHKKQAISASHSHIYETADEEMTTQPFKGSNLKVGNKKSDKFFGENLSDSLSDEPYHSADEGILARKRLVDKDELDVFVEQNVTKVENKMVSEAAPESHEDRMSDSLDKKAAFLMTMLDKYDDQDDAERYKGMVPVEEPIIVPKKRITRCICDETDHLIKHLRNEKCTEHGHLSRTESTANEKKDVSTETPPIKPRRDLELYRKSLELKGDEIENYPSPPIRRKRSMSNSKEALPLLDKSSNDAETDKDTSALLTQDIVEHLVNNAYGMTPYMNIEDIHQNSHNDGAQDVSEGISKLKTRRRSSNRQPSLENVNSLNLDLSGLSSSATAEETTEFPLSCKNVTVSPLNSKEGPIRFESLHPSPTKEEKPLVEPKQSEKRIRIKESYLEEHDNTDEQQNLQNNQEEDQESHKLAEDVVHSLEELIRHQNFNTTGDVLDEIYKHHNSIVFEFQQFLEDELNKTEQLEKLKSIATENKLHKEAKDKAVKIKDVENELQFDESKNETQLIELGSSASSDISDPDPSPIRTTANMIKETTIEPVVLQKRDSIEGEVNWSSNSSDVSDLSQTQLELVSSSSASSDISDASTLKNISDVEDEVNSKKPILTNKILDEIKKEGYVSRRKESIDDVDNWFTQHLDMPNVEMSQTLLQEDEKKANLLGYDSVKLFPFGEPRERQLSLNEEFFVGKGSEEKKMSEPKRSTSESTANS